MQQVKVTAERLVLGPAHRVSAQDANEEAISAGGEQAVSNIPKAATKGSSKATGSSTQLETGKTSQRGTKQKRTRVIRKAPVSVVEPLEPSELENEIEPESKIVVKPASTPDPAPPAAVTPKPTSELPEQTAELPPKPASIKATVRKPQPAPALEPKPQQLVDPDPAAARPARPAPIKQDSAKLEGKIAALETLIARSQGQWEPAVPQLDESPQPAPTNIQTRAGNSAPHEAQSVSPAPITNQIDEDKFRQFVAEIVREELKGHLDIRMNRLVRNIVGREIKRALDKPEKD